MAHQIQTTTQVLFPFLRYRDALAAIDWLVKGFGFSEQMVVPGENGTVAHAQLGFGSGVIMLGTARDDELGMKSPRDLGAVNQGIYVYVEDVDSHYERARVADAEIVRGPEDTDYGSREYTARDLEGHLWSFGTYRPSGGALVSGNRSNSCAKFASTCPRRPKSRSVAIRTLPGACETRSS